MKVVVDGTTDEVRIEDAENLQGLSVELHEVDAERADELLDDLGRIEGEHAWLNIHLLHARTPTPRSCSWDGRFVQTMEYAARKGWTDETGSFVRAHIETLNAQV